MTIKLLLNLLVALTILLSFEAFSQQTKGSYHESIQATAINTTSQPKKPATSFNVNKAPCNASSCAAPITIPVVLSAQACVNECNDDAGAVPGPNFVGNNCYDFPASTVWFEVYAPTGTSTFDINISSVFADPYYTIFTTADCITYTIVDCYQGAGGVAINSSSVAMESTFLIAVSDGNGAEGDFTLCITPMPDQSACNIDNVLAATATSMGSPLAGPYQPGETVNFCYTINTFDQQGCNWLQGIVPSFGNCWDASSFDANDMPVVTTALIGAGNFYAPDGAWNWWPSGSVTYNNLGNPAHPNGSDVGAGWFFSEDGTNDPDFGWGDGNGMGPIGSCQGATSGLTWTVCFELTATMDCATFVDCSVSMETFGDGEIGGWDQAGCVADEPTVLPGGITCCTLMPDAGLDDALCFGSSVGLTGSYIGNDGATAVVWTSNPAGAAADLDNATILTPTYTPTSTGVVTFYMEATDQSCTRLDSVFITTYAVPDVNPLANQVACDTYTLPVITGTNLTGNEAYYDATNGGGTQYLAGAAITTAGVNTLYIYDETGTVPNCFDEETFTVTINLTPNINPLANQVACDTYTLPVITGTNLSGNEAYYDAPNGGGTQYLAGAAITTVGVNTLYIYDETGTIPNCFDEETFTVTINLTPDVNPLANQVACDSYTLPAITGTNLTGNEAYYDAPNGGGTQYLAGAAITTAGVNTLYIYDETGTVPNCFDEETFTVTINLTPAVNPLANQVACDSYTLPVITGTNLTGNEAYYDAPNGGGTQYLAGAAITTAGVNTLYIYDETGTVPNCFDEETFTVTINISPDINPLANQVACDSYTLPAITGTNLSGNEAYYDAPNGGGTQYLAGAAITNTGVNTLYIYDETGTIPNCFDEETFTVTINLTPDVNPLANQVACGTYTLPAITGTNLTGNEAYYDAPNGGGTQYLAGAAITTVGVNTLYIYDETGTVPNCFDEETFTVTINVTPDANPLANQVACDSYTLPVITGTDLTGNEAYYDAPNGGGTQYLAGAAITTVGVNTLYIYDETGTVPNCFDEETFTVTINLTPDVNPLANQVACDTYTLPAITGTNLSGNEAYYDAPNGGGTQYLAGAAITTAGVNTLYIYDETGTVPNCFDEETFTVTINLTPDVNPLANQVACDSYTLPVITGTNLTGNEAYYDAPNGGGTQYLAGAAITTAGVNTLYIYDETGTVPNCFDEETFTVTITITPTYTLTPTDPTVCNGTDGSILIDGLIAGGTYDVVYNDGSGPVLLPGEVANGSGQITIGSLGAGSYDVIVTPTGTSCAGIIVSTSLANPGAPILDVIADTSACSVDYTLQAITGSSLSGSEAYYDAPGGPTGGGAVIPVGTIFTAPTNITLYAYDESGPCNDEEAFTINIYTTPVIDPMADQVACDTYALPVITGTNLSGNEAYYDAPNGGGTQFLAGAAITTAGVNTLYIYDETGTIPNCFDEETFTVTINLTPDVNPLANQVACDTYTLPAITGTNLSGNEAYYDAPNGSGTQFLAGAAITAAGVNTLYIYDETGTVPNCFDEETFTVTINLTPDVNPLANQVACDTYTLPAITGTNLSGNEAYYDAPNGGGTQYLAGAAITTVGVNTLYIYDETGTVPNCFDEETFTVTINLSPNVNPLANQEACDTYTLPAITGTNLSGNEAYYNAPNGGGTQYLAGAAITTAGVNTLYIYDETGTVPNCFDEETFTVTINLSPDVNPLANQEACGTYTLPAITGTNLSGNEAYYDAPNGGGTQYLAGAAITTAGVNTLYIYDETGTVPNCFDEETFNVTINISPDVNPLANQVACDTYTLPAITGTNLSGNQAYYDAPNGGGTQYLSGVVITTAGVNTLYIYDETGTVPNCFDEETFTVTINLSPDINAIASLTECDSVQLPAITGTNLTGNEAYYDGLLGTGASYAPGDWVASSVLMYSYDQTGTTPNCFDDESFAVTINLTPDVDPMAAMTGCDSVQLSAITGTNLTGSESYYSGLGGTGTAYSASDYITSTMTIYTYDETGTAPNCFDEESFNITVNLSPDIDPIAAMSNCDSVQLGAITGTNLTSGESYFDGIGGTGTMYSASDWITSSMTLYAYDETGSAPNCFDEESFVVTVNSSPTYSLAPTDPSICDGTDGSILINGLVAGTDYEVTYFDGVSSVGPTTMTSNGAGEITIGTLGSATYDVTLSVTVTGCIGSTEQTVLINPGAPVLDVISDVTVCDVFNLAAITGTGLSGNESYWTGTGGTGTQYNASDAINTSMTIYAYDASGACSDEVSFVITVNNTPAIDPIADVTACETYVLPAITGTNLSGSEAFYNNSQAGGGTVISGSVTNSQTVYAYDDNGLCSSEISFVVTINPLPTVTSVSGGATYCEGDVIADVMTDVTGTGSWTIDYTLDGVAQSVNSASNPISLGNTEGVYIITGVTDANCANTANGTATIVVNPIPPAPTAGTDATYCSTVDYDNMVATGTNGTLTWYSDAGLTNVLGTGTTQMPEDVNGTTIYYVTETMAGCESIASEVIIGIVDCDITVPTAFTPDGDMVNDDWEILDLDTTYPENQVFVYNRWGNLLFTSDQGAYNSNRWDGSYAGSKLPVGSYYFIIEFNDKDQGSTSGTVSIILNK